MQALLTKWWPVLALVSATAWPQAVRADEALARKAACTACHAVEKKLLGPSFRDIAQRYKTQADAATLVAAKIRKGGSGAWGPVPMPAQPQLSEPDLQALTTWILSLP